MTTHLQDSDWDNGAHAMRRARVEYTLVGSRLVGSVTFPGRPPQSFESATELERCLSRGVGGLVLVDSSIAPGEDLEGLATLTPTEQAIAERAAMGASNREIADSLYYSVKSVEAYLTRIYRRLGVEGREGLSALVGTEDLEPLPSEGELVGGGAGGPAVAGAVASARPSVVVELLIA